MASGALIRRREGNELISSMAVYAWASLRGTVPFSSCSYPIYVDATLNTTTSTSTAMIPHSTSNSSLPSTSPSSSACMPHGQGSTTCHATWALQSTRHSGTTLTPWHSSHLLPPVVASLLPQYALPHSQRFPTAALDCCPAHVLHVRQYARKRDILEERQAVREQKLASRLRRKARRPVFRPTVPAGVDIQLSNPLMIHYKKGLSGRQLTYRLVKRIKINDIRDFVLLYEKGVTPNRIAIAAVLTQLNHSKRLDPTFSYSSEAVQQIMDRLIPAMIQQMPWSTLRIVSVWLWAASGLKLTSGIAPVMSTELVGILLARATQSTRNLAECSPRRLSLLAYSTSKLLTRKQFQATPPAVEALRKISSAAPPKLHHFSPQGLANLACALSSLEVLDASLAAAIAEESSKRIGDLAVRQYTAPDYIGVLRALVLQEDPTKHKKLFAQVAGVLSLPGGLDGFRPSQLASLARAFAAAGLRHDGLMHSVANAVISKIGRFPPGALKDVGASFTTLDVNHPPLLQALQAAAKV